MTEIPKAWATPKRQKLDPFAFMHTCNRWQWHPAAGRGKLKGTEREREGACCFEFDMGKPSIAKNMFLSAWAQHQRDTRG